MTNTADTKYNGWTNWETWNVALHLDNNQSEQEYWMEHAQSTLDESGSDGHFTKEERAVLTLSEELKAVHDDNMEDLGVPKLSGFYADLLNMALKEVNWHEIAKHYIEAVIEAREFQAKKGDK